MRKHQQFGSSNSRKARSSRDIAKKRAFKVAWDQLEDRATPVVGAFGIPAPVAAGAGYDGVVQLFMGGSSCSGTLLPTGRHILTAAHCVTDSSGVQDVTNVTVNFQLVGRSASMNATVTYINPSWDGNTFHGNDVAILTLDALAPIDAERYGLYTDALTDVGSNFTIVGYGNTGTGDTGQNTNDEEQRISFAGTVTGGTYTLTFDGQTTAALAYNATAAQIQSALEALSNIGAGNVNVEGGPATGLPTDIVFAGSLANSAQPLTTADGTNLTGGGSVAVTQLIAGGQGLGGVKRLGQNRFDATGGVIGLAGAAATGTLGYDFDNGNPGNDAFGVEHALPNTGLGAAEADQAAGDSGGPAFIGNLIAGIVSVSRPLRDAFSAAPPDVDGWGNNSFGEYAVMTRVSSYAADITNAISGAFQLIIDMNDQPGGNDGSPDDLRLLRNGPFVEFYINGLLAVTEAFASLTGIDIIGSGDDDRLTVDMRTGSPVPTGGLSFDGGGQTTSPDGDTLAVIGNGTNTGVYYPSATTTGSGLVTVDFDHISFLNLEPVIVSAMENFTLVTPNAADFLNIDSNGTGRNRISGTSGLVAIESLTFFDIQRFTLDAATNDGAGAPDDIALFAPGLIASELQAFRVNTGGGDDAFRVFNPRLGVTVGNAPIVFDAGTGDNTIQAAADTDFTLFNDHLESAAGGTVFFTGVNRASLAGGIGNNRLDASQFTFGPVTLQGGSGDDTLLGGAGNDVLNGNDGNDIIIPSGGTDTVDGGAGFDEIFVNGTNGNDTISVAQALALVTINVNGSLSTNDTTSIDRISVHGRDGNDAITLSGLLIPALVDAGSGNDTIDASAVTAVNLILVGGYGNDTITGGAGNDTLAGGEGDDVLIGGAGNDSIDGGDGDDQITGGTGDDSLFGDDDSDTFNWSAGDGNDLVEGGTGLDILNFDGVDGAANLFALAASGTRITVSLAGVPRINGAAIETVNLSDGNTVGDTFHVGDLSGTGVRLVNLTYSLSFDNNATLSGTPLADNVVLNSVGGPVGTTTVTGLAAEVRILNTGVSTPVLFDRVTVQGLGGNDHLKAEPGAEAVIGITLDGGIGDDTLSADATLLGGAGNDLFYPANGTNVIDGGAGFDQIIVDGTGGNDTISVTEAAGVVITIAVNANSSTNTVSNVEHIAVNGLAGNDTITLSGLTIPATVDAGGGNDGVNASGVTAVNLILLGGDGNDTILGGAGNDTIDGGAGNDNLLGGGGNDYISAGDGNDTITGGTGVDSLFGDAGSDLFIWNNGDGSDLVEGGEGDDTQVVNGDPVNGNDFNVSAAGIRVLFQRTNLGTFSLDIGTVESLGIVGSTSTDNINVGNLRDTDLRLIVADLGVDAVRDTVTVAGTNLGDDIGITTTAPGIVSVEQSQNAHVVLRNTSANCPLLPNDDTLTINAGQGNDTIQASQGVEEEIGLFINAQDGNDFVRANGVIFGGNGNDTLEGAGGLCPLFIDGGNGNDSICGNDGNDTLIGGAGNDTIYGNDGNDLINGGDGRDVLVGNAGDDTINGGNGDDLLLGGAGNDVLNGDAGNDLLLGDADAECGNDEILLLDSGQGNDTLDGGTGNDALNGDVGDDSLVGGDGNDLLGPVSFAGINFGDAGNDTMRGGAGNDTINGDSGNDLIEGNDGDDLISGGTGNDTIQGGNGNDTINGDAGNDFIHGNDGDDLISGGTGNDTISGGNGNDTIHGDDGNDIIFGDDGNDLIDGGDGDDVISAGAGNDTIYGDAGNDEIHGDDGNDLIYGGDGDDVISGGAGNDTINGGDGNDEIFGGAGDDLISGGNGHDTIFGNAGNDTIFGDAGNDSVFGGDGHDLITGGTGNDSLCGEAGNDSISGGDGNDVLNGGDGNDLLHGDAGNDQIWGSAGNDSIYGGDGCDSLVGGDGNDFIDGGNGNDFIWGQAGNDTLWGGNGDDLMYGGLGNDVMLGGTPATANTVHKPRDPRLPSDGNDTMLGGDGFDRVDGGNGNNMLDAGDDGIRETILGGLGNDFGYTHTGTSGHATGDVAALDGGFNHIFKVGGLLEINPPAESCVYTNFVIPTSAYYGWKLRHDGVLVQHPDKRPSNVPFKGVRNKIVDDKPTPPVKAPVKAPAKPTVKITKPAPATRASLFAARAALLKSLRAKG